MREQKSFIEMYKEETRKPSPRLAFLLRVQQVTGRSLPTIRRWASGELIPDKGMQRLIADEFGVPPEVLFPREH